MENNCERGATSGGGSRKYSSWKQKLKPQRGNKSCQRAFYQRRWEEKAGWSHVQLYDGQMSEVGAGRGCKERPPHSCHVLSISCVKIGETTATRGARARLLGIITIHTGCVCAWGDEQKRFFSHAFTLEGLPGGRKGELVMVKYCYTKCFFHLYNCLIVSDESLSLKAEPIDVCTATKKANQL